MGMSKAIIAIKDSDSSKLPQIVEAVNYIEDDSLLSKWLESMKSENGWLVLPDDDMVFVSEDDLLLELAETLDTQVLGLLVQSTSGTYGFNYFDAKNEKVSRVFLAQDTEIIEDSGEKLTIESKLTINESITDTDIIAIANSFGIVFED